MSNKVENYVYVLFQDIPKTTKALELKEELLANLLDRYNDYIAEGKTENQAYSLAIANLGDIDDILKDVIPTENFKIQNNKYRQIKARNVTFAIILYMFFPIILISLNTIFNNSNLTIMLALTIPAIATGILIYTYMSIPSEHKLILDELVDNNITNLTNQKLNISKKIISTSIICIYLIIGLFFNIWFGSINIFIMGFLIWKITKTVIILKEGSFH